MSGKKPSLGRGLAELSPLMAKRVGAPLHEPPALQPGALAGDRLANLPLDLLQRGKFQPRVDMRTETLSELADSIKSQGLVQPILVRPVGIRNPGESQRYEIIAGERRWRAAQMAGLAAVPAIIRDVPDEAAVSMALIENIQREDLNPLEEAGARLRAARGGGLSPPARPDDDACPPAANRAKWRPSWPRNHCRCATPKLWCAASSIRPPPAATNPRDRTRIFRVWNVNWPTNWAPKWLSSTR